MGDGFAQTSADDFLKASSPKRRGSEIFQRLWALTFAGMTKTERRTVIGKAPFPHCAVRGTSRGAALFLVGFVTFLKDLRVDVLGPGPTALGDVT